MWEKSLKQIHDSPLRSTPSPPGFGPPKIGGISESWYHGLRILRPVYFSSKGALALLIRFFDSPVGGVLLYLRLSLSLYLGSGCASLSRLGTRAFRCHLFWDEASMCIRLPSGRESDLGEVLRLEHFGFVRSQLTSPSQI